LTPMLAGIAWLILLIALAHPARQAVIASPEQFRMNCRDVTFVTSDGVKLGGWYTNSLSVGDMLEKSRWKKLRPGAVLCHGYGAARDQLLYPIGKQLVEAGYDVLLIDFRGHGTSDEASVTLGPAEAADVKAAVRFLQAQPGVDDQRIALVGFGMGGYSAILAAAQSPDVRCVVAVDAYPSVITMLQRNCQRLRIPAVIGTALGWGMRFCFVDATANDDAVEAVRVLGLGDRGLLLVTGGGADAGMPATDMEPLFTGAGEKAAKMTLPGVNRGEAIFKSTTAEMIVRYLDAFCQRSDGSSQAITVSQQPSLR